MANMGGVMNLVHYRIKVSPEDEMLSGILEYSERITAECLASTEPILAPDAWKEKMEAAVYNLKAFKHHYNLVMIRQLGGDVGDLREILRVMAPLKPNSPATQKQLAHMIKVAYDFMSNKGK